MKFFKALSDRDEFKSFYKIENMQNTDFVKDMQVDTNQNKLGFTSNGLFNDQFSLMDIGEMTGLEVYNKTERK